MARPLPRRRARPSTGWPPPGSTRDAAAYGTAREAVDEVLHGFRAAPLSREEEVRRAGQFLRFLALVPVEYGRGVADGKVTVPFEIQEAVTFRDGAAQAFADLESVLTERDAVAVGRIEELVATIGAELADASRGGAVAAEDVVEAHVAEALDLAEGIFPDEWQDAGAAADFDVIRTSLDRVVGAVRAGEYGSAEQARLEAYAFFEFGPEQRLRGLAPDLFIRTESLFWYGADGFPGLAQLIRRKASPEEVMATRGGAGRGARGLGGCRRGRADVGRGRRDEHGDHRLPRGAGGRAHPGRAHRGARGRAAPAAPAAVPRCRRCPRRLRR